MMKATAMSGMRFFIPAKVIQALPDAEWDRLQRLVITQAVGGFDAPTADGWVVHTKDGTELQDLLLALLRTEAWDEESDSLLDTDHDPQQRDLG